MRARRISGGPQSRLVASPSKSDSDSLKHPPPAALVRAVRLELTLPKERVFETRASTDSATPA